MDMKLFKRIIVVTFLIIVFFIISLGVSIIKDKNSYILGLQSDRKICNDKLDEQIGEYAKIKNELKKYQRKYGEIE